MKFIETRLKGAFIIEMNKREDSRGFFSRVWCKSEFEKHNLKTDIVQANVSCSRKKGTLRGLHFQHPPHAETKIVRCTEGSFYEVIVDLRPESATYMQWEGIVLTAENFRMMYIPEGFAHGFMTLSDNTYAHYMVTQYYSAEAEDGLPYNDPAFNISWPMEPEEISEKDRNHIPFFQKQNSKLWVPSLTKQRAESLTASN